MYDRYFFVLLVSMLASPAFAVWSTESVAITGGTFTLSDADNTFGVMSILPGPSHILDDGISNGAVDADGLHGSAASSVTTFSFLGNSWKTFFAHSVESCSANCASMITLTDPEPGAITMTGPWNAVLSADFSGFFTEWNGNRFWQGGQATGTAEWILPPTVESGSGVFGFTLHWSLLNPGGPFQGMTSDWVLTGTAVAVVPEPTTYVLMLAGIALIGGVSRRRFATVQ
jgi:hypothetical protein